MKSSSVRGNATEIVILHREKAKVSGAPMWGLAHSHWVKWETCLRQVYFGTSDFIPTELADDVEVYRGREAYEFCMQTVCGLKSPLIGETEVWGQFKALFRYFEYASIENGSVLQKFVENIFADAKQIRHRHLTGIGSQSYGSLARKLLKGVDEITIVGSGLLVKDMLPWLVKGPNKVRFVCRNADKARERLGELKVKPENVEIKHIDDSLELVSGALIIAAPVKSDWVQQRFASGELEKVVDLRDNSTKDRVEMSCEVVPLIDFFSEIESTRKLLKTKVVEAETEINSMMKKRFNQIQIRPFGWEDLCL